ncbi:acyl carrier protein [Weissella koreensis KCTC 3621]|uniref:acyl carrier protein n=1 Tax=Weissella koreensis TaxID=165096 RepID=UPI00026F1EAC|nr:acyl carrier protein [Weissella koreensis]EJF33949.1 acyl carrier protein [Weissella koreensis KCTC 3621]EJF34239.1 acyl carrier protein [Weissella koreensis KCTC 3621]
MLEKKVIYDRVAALVADHFELSTDQISGDLNFLNDIDVDSIDFVELVLEMEDEFDAEIPDEDADKLTTINQTVDYIYEHQAKK